MLNKLLTEEQIKVIEDTNCSRAPITLTKGKYNIEFCKVDDVSYAYAILSRKDGEGYTHIADFPVTLIQENVEMGIQFEFNLK